MKPLLDTLRSMAEGTGRFLRQVAREILDPWADHGTGPLLRCKNCEEVRRDVDSEQLCRPCWRRTW